MKAQKAEYYRKNADAIKERVRNYAKRNPDKIVDQQLRREYGISLEEFRVLEVSQEGKCKICRGPPTIKRRRLSVDHDHQTGRVRALLCGACNTMIGLAREQPALLQAAIEYLKEFK